MRQTHTHMQLQCPSPCLSACLSSASVHSIIPSHTRVNQQLQCTVRMSLGCDLGIRERMIFRRRLYCTVSKRQVVGDMDCHQYHRAVLFLCMNTITRHALYCFPRLVLSSFQVWEEIHTTHPTTVQAISPTIIPY